MEQVFLGILEASVYLVIDEILKVPGIGAVFFGPSDYTVSSGNFGKSTDEADAALYTVKNACNAAGIPFVGFADASNINRRIEENFNMLIIGSDIDKSGSASSVLDYLRESQ